MARIISLIAIAVVLLLTGLVALALVNLNGYLNGHKERLIADIERRVGVRLWVGEISMTIWGGVGMRLDRVSFKDDAALASGSLLRADYARVSLSFPALLRNELKIKNVSFQKPVLTIFRHPHGPFEASPPATRRLTNFLGGRVSLKQAGTGSDSGSGSARLHRGMIVLLRGSNVKIYDGEIHFADGNGNMIIIARNVMARLEALQPDRAASVEITAAVLEAERPNVHLRALLGPWLPDSRAHALPVKGRIDAAGLSLEALKRVLSGAIRLPPGMVTEGDATLEVEWRGSLEHLVVKGKMDATRSFIAAGKCCVKRSGTPLLLAVEAHITESRIAIRRARVELGAMVFEAIGEFDRWMPVSMRLTVDSETIKLARLKTIFPALRRYRLSGHAKLHSRVRGELGKGKQPRISGVLSLSKINFALPKIGAAVATRQAKIVVATTGSGATRNTSRIPAVSGEAGSPSFTRYEFHAPELRFTGYSAGPTREAEPQIIRDARSTGSFDPFGESPVGRGEFFSAQGTLSRLDYAHLTGAFRVADDFFSVERLYVKVLEGSIEGGGDYRFAGTPSRFRFRGRGQKLNLALLRDESTEGISENIRGTLDLDFDVDGRIQNGAPIPMAVRAQGEARVTAGAIPEINLPEEVLASANGLGHFSWLLSFEMRRKYPQIFHANSTRFEYLKATFKLQNNKLRLDEWNLSGADYVAHGNGWIDARGNVDLRAVLGLSGGLAADLAYDLGDVPFAKTQNGYKWIPFSLAGVFPRLHSDALKGVD